MPDLPKLTIFEKTRGLFTPVKDVRRQVLTEVAKMIVKSKTPALIRYRISLSPSRPCLLQIISFVEKKNEVSTIPPSLLYGPGGKG